MAVAKASDTVARVRYEDDVLLWSQEQAKLLRERRFAELDVDHLADEIEDVGKSEKLELASRCAVLLAHLMKWAAQPEKRSNCWRRTIDDQRRRISLALKETLSLVTVLENSDWREEVWLDACAQAVKEPASPVKLFRKHWLGR